MSTKANILVSIVFLFSIVLNVKPSNAETFNTTANIYKRLSAVQCDSLIKANETNPNFVILDVRTLAEYNSYHLMGSINRNSGDANFDSQLSALPKLKRFLLHCQSGGRSAGAFTKMKNLDYAEVYEMIGGLNAWVNASLPTTKITGPKLMLVSYKGILTSSISDTVKVTITNRANEKLTFSTVLFSDVHYIENNFNNETNLEGAQDYTFTIVHSPIYSGDDSTKIRLESNGGNLELNIVFKNGVIQGIDAIGIEEITLYPNPARDKLYFKNMNADIINNFSVINIVGKIVLNENVVLSNEGIDVSGLLNGIYVARIKTGQQIVSKKFVLKK